MMGYKVVIVSCEYAHIEEIWVSKEGGILSRVVKTASPPTSDSAEIYIWEHVNVQRPPKPNF